MSSAQTRLAYAIMLFVLAVYLALLPWTGQAWLRTGDEPHYLVAAESLARDGDFDLRNNYDPAVYLDWYPSANLNRQVQTRPDGAQFLIHTYGLPILIAPAFWLAGARGVAYFMALLGALLAGQVYLLSYRVTQHWLASALSALVVALAPPVVWYVYLLYPELAGALCVTVAARVLVDLSPGGVRSFGPQLLLGLCLAALPWLSARFIPAALVLAGLAVLRVAFPITNFQSLITKLFRLWPSLLLLALSLAGLAWFNAVHYGSAAVTASYTVDSSPGPLSWPMLLQFVRGVFGWLIDHQRGLLVAAPIYLVAFIGLGQWLWRGASRWAALVVALPFAAVLGSTALIGGFWVGVEPAARYLVFVLPPLGAALAYAWVHRRGPWLAGLTVLTLAFSLWTGLQVFREPLLAQTHDLIGEQLPGLAPFLPALGKPVFLAPGAVGELAAPLADPPEQPALWRVPKGQAGSALQQAAIPDLPFGWYTLHFSLGANGAPAEAPVARVLFQTGDHTPLVDTMLYGRDFTPDGQLRDFSLPVFNDLYNQWEQPAGLWIFTTGRADLTLSQVVLQPDTFHSLVVPALWLAGLAVVGVVIGLRSHSTGEPALAPPILPRWLGGWAPALIGAVLVAGVGAWSLRPVARSYAVADLANYIGSRVPDGAAEGGLALSTAGDEATPGVLATTGPGIWPAGRYRWRFSLKATGPASAAGSAASVAILAPRQSVAGFPAQVAAGSVPADGQFHTLEIQFDNPIRQALVLELDASGAAPLETQGFQVSPVP